MIIAQEPEDIVLVMREVKMLLQLVSYKMEKVQPEMSADPSEIKENMLDPLDTITNYMKVWFENYDDLYDNVN